MILPDRDRRFRFGNTRIPFFMAPYILVCLIFLFILTRIYKTKEYNIAGGKEYFVEEYKKLGKVTLVEKKAAISLLFLFLFILTSSWHGLDTLFGFIAAVVYLFLPGINVGKKKRLPRSIWALSRSWSPVVASGLWAALWGLISW